MDDVEPFNVESRLIFSPYMTLGYAMLVVMFAMLAGVHAGMLVGFNVIPSLALVLLLVGQVRRTESHIRPRLCEDGGNDRCIYAVDLLQEERVAGALRMRLAFCIIRFRR